jgi:hypothetical protein
MSNRNALAVAKKAPHLLSLSVKMAMTTRGRHVRECQRFLRINVNAVRRLRAACGMLEWSIVGSRSRLLRARPFVTAELFDDHRKRLAYTPGTSDGIISRSTVAFIGRGNRS